MTQKVSKERRYVFGIIEFSTIVDPTVFLSFSGFYLGLCAGGIRRRGKVKCD
jgi:hypothetical protein